MRVTGYLSNPDPMSLACHPSNRRSQQGRVSPHYRSAVTAVDGAPAVRYLLKYKTYLHYDEYLRDGQPIASGVIEGACRHLVRDRLDLGGARWSLTTAEAVLQLRALKPSGDFAKRIGNIMSSKSIRATTRLDIRGPYPP
jgi:hypothetical protein